MRVSQTIVAVITVRDWSNLNLSQQTENITMENLSSLNLNQDRNRHKIKPRSVPTDILFQIFKFYDPKWELNKNFAKFRHEAKKKKIQMLSDEIKASMPFVRYNTCSIRYFRIRRNRANRSSMSYWRCTNCFQANSLSNSKCTMCNETNHTKSHFSEKFKTSKKNSKIQCIAKTKAGERCKKKTFGIFCKCHEACTVAYWI